MRPLVLFIFIFAFCKPSQSQTKQKWQGETYGVTFTFPWLNYYRFVDYNKNDLSKKFGFFGVGIAAYYKKNKNVIAINYSATQDLSSPIAKINYAKKEIVTSIGSSFFELIYQRPIHTDFSMIMGGNFTNYYFHLASSLDSIKSYTKTDQTLGISAGIAYHFNSYYSVAAIYRPAIASFETDQLYRHLITVELRIDLDVWNKKKWLQ
jgi:long-subunit fatty acid transport protein